MRTDKYLGNLWRIPHGKLFLQWLNKGIQNDRDNIFDLGLQHINNTFFLKKSRSSQKICEILEVKVKLLTQMKYQSGFQSRSLKKLATSFPIWLEVIASDALEIKARFFPRFNSNLKIDVSQEWSDVIWCYRFDFFFICGWRFEKAWAKKKIVENFLFSANSVKKNVDSKYFQVRKIPYVKTKSFNPIWMRVNTFCLWK